MGRSFRVSMAAFLAAILSLDSFAPAGAGEALLFWETEGAQDVEDRVWANVTATLNTTLVGPFAASVERDLSGLQAALAPALGSLSADTSGRFGSAATRYALHRLFMRLRGWSVVGLNPEGQAWTGTWVEKVALLDRAPKVVKVMIGQLVEGPGLSAKGVALLAVLLQHLARVEVAEVLRDVMRALKFPVSSTLGPVQASTALDLHMASLVLARLPAGMSRKKWLREVQAVAKVYPGWPELKKSVHEELRRGLQAQKPSFASLARVAGDIGERWGHWGDSECGSLKRELVKVEDQGSGRVRLADFYGLALHGGKWQLAESVEYLRQLGALDESSKGGPRVIIPNYIEASGNCIASTQVMAVCCISECEDIMQQLMAALRVPEATPEQIVAAVASLPSSTVPAGRELSTVMLSRLNRIAADSSGVVPLHGRLFAQWLHHAYPRECPYPYLAGRTKQQQMEDFRRETGHNFSASSSEMAAIAGKDASSWKHPRKSRPIESAPWSHEEELFVPRAQRPDALVVLHASVLVAAIAVGTLGYAILRLARSARRTAAELAEANPMKFYPV